MEKEKCIALGMKLTKDIFDADVEAGDTLAAIAFACSTVVNALVWTGANRQEVTGTLLDCISECCNKNFEEYFNNKQQ